MQKLQKIQKEILARDWVIFKCEFHKRVGVKDLVFTERCLRKRTMYFLEKTGHVTILEYKQGTGGVTGAGRGHIKYKWNLTPIQFLTYIVRYCNINIDNIPMYIIKWASNQHEI